MTWNQAETASRHGMGSEKIMNPKEFRHKLHQIAENKNLLAFRYFGKKAMVGYRDGAVFYILAIDRNFSLYAHE